MNAKALILEVVIVTLALLYTPRAEAVTLEESLNAWWLMGENAELAPPDGGGGNEDIINSIPEHTGDGPMVVSQGTPTRVDGVPFSPYPHPGSFASQVGDGNFFSVGAEPSLDLTGDFTYSLWVRNTGSGSFLKMFSHHINPGLAQLETDGAGGVVWNVRIPVRPSNSEIDTSPFLDGNWHHLALWRSGGTVGAFVDGVDIGLGQFGEEQNLDANEMFTGTTSFTIGNQADGNAGFPGLIDDFRIYDIALSQQEAAAIYNNGTGDFGADEMTAVTLENNIVNWWLMGENADIGVGNPTRTIVSLPEHLGNENLTAVAQGTPQRVAGSSFDPFPFGDTSYATRSGPGSYLTVGPHASLDLGGDFSYSLWVRRTGPGQFLKMFQHQTSPPGSFAQVETDNPGGIVWNVRVNGNNSEVNTTPFLGDGEWHHLALWRQGGTVGVYVDGEVIGLGGFGEQQLLGDTDMLTGTTGFGLGAQVDGDAAFPGEIDDFRIYTVALNQEQARMIYNDGLGDLLSLPFAITAFARNDVAEQLEITFNSIAGRDYAIDLSDTLRDGVWAEASDLQGADGSSTSATVSFENIMLNYGGNLPGVLNVRVRDITVQDDPNP